MMATRLATRRSFWRSPTPSRLADRAASDRAVGEPGVGRMRDCFLLHGGVHHPLGIVGLYRPALEALLQQGGDLLLTQLLALAAPSAEGPLSYNERYKHFDRLIVWGFHSALWQARDAGGGPAGLPPLSEGTDDTTIRAGWRFAD
jgi:hypothetical protein